MASTNNNADSGKEEKKEVPQVIINAEDFDFEHYISSYTGQTKILRLIAIAERCKSLQSSATKLALEELKKSVNTALYKAVADKAAQEFKLGSSFAADSYVRSTDAFVPL